MISGPLNNGGEVPGSPLTILEANKIHPARVRCQATCLDQQGTSYYPTEAMAIILRGQEHYIPIVPVYGARDSFNYSQHGLHFEIRVSYNCDAQNNYTMEYEYLITSNASKIDRSVVFCGIKYYDWTYHHDRVLPVCTCWGQSYGIILYAEVDTLADYHAPTDLLSTQTYSIASYNNTDVECVYYDLIQPIYIGQPHNNINRARAAGWLVYIYTLIPIILVIIVITITLTLTTGFLYLRSHRRQKSTPQCV